MGGGSWLMDLLASRALALALVAACALASACTPKPPAATQPAARPERLDPTPPVPLVVHLAVYQVDVPAGSVSRSDEFWRRVDEAAVGVTAYDILYKNGIRVGRAPTAEWPYFKKLLDQNPARTQATSHMAREARSIELIVKPDLLAQTIFAFDLQNQLQGRTYERSQNVLSLSFQPTPRRLGDVRVALAPMVRTLRRVYVPIGDVETRGWDLVSPERYYDLGLRADISLDHFLVVAPSPEAFWTTTVGHNFLVHEGESERFEQVILLVPRLYRLLEDRPATRP